MRSAPPIGVSWKKSTCGWGRSGEPHRWISHMIQPGTSETFANAGCHSSRPEISNSVRRCDQRMRVAITEKHGKWRWVI
jgi:hypothetical protein